MDIEEQYDKIYRFCYYRLKNREAAEDITQETFLRWFASDTYRNKNQALQYLYTIARNLCIDEYRRREPDMFADEAQLPAGDPADSFLRELETSLPYLEGERLRLWCYESNSPFCTFFDNVNGFYNFPRDSSAAEFYSLRHGLVEQLWENSELSDGEKTYWEKCLCPSFSEDHKRQTEPLIFSSKNSRSSLFLARLSAGLFTGMLSAVILLAAYTAGACLIYGTGGLDAPMQMIEITLSNPVSVGGMMRSLAFLLICHAAVWSAFTMLVSAWSRSAVAALAIPFFLSWFSLRMRPPVTRLTALLPQYMICEYSFRDLWLNRIFGVYLDGLQTFLLLCGLCWRRDAVCR